MANKGSLGSVKILSEETWESMHDEKKLAKDYGIRAETSFSQGGVNYFRSDLKLLLITV